MSTQHLDTYVHSSQKPSVRQQINVWSIQTVEHHSATKRSEYTHGLNLDEAGDVMLSERPASKTTSRTIPLTGNTQN